MKLLPILVLFISLNSHANTHSVEDFINAKINLLEVQITQLNNAITLMQSDISDTEQYELIGKPSFIAIENALNSFAFNVESYYEFEANNQQNISHYLTINDNTATTIEYLQTELETKTQIFDNIK